MVVISTLPACSIGSAVALPYTLVDVAVTMCTLGTVHSNFGMYVANGIDDKPLPKNMISLTHDNGMLLGASRAAGASVAGGYRPLSTAPTYQAPVPTYPKSHIITSCPNGYKLILPETNPGDAYCSEQPVIHRSSSCPSGQQLVYSNGGEVCSYHVQ